MNSRRGEPSVFMASNELSSWAQRLLCGVTCYPGRHV